jgi:hypothetical protein
MAMVARMKMKFGREKETEHVCGIDCMIKAAEVRLRSAIYDDESEALVQFLHDDLEALKEQQKRRKQVKWKYFPISKN